MFVKFQFNYLTNYVVKDYVVLVVHYKTLGGEGVHVIFKVILSHHKIMDQHEIARLCTKNSVYVLNYFSSFQYT